VPLVVFSELIFSITMEVTAYSGEIVAAAAPW